MQKYNITESVINYSIALRENGIRIGITQIIDACKSIQIIDISSKDEFYWSLRSNLIIRNVDVQTFNYLFDVFFRNTLDQIVNKKELSFDSDNIINKNISSLLPDKSKEWANKAEIDISAFINFDHWFSKSDESINGNTKPSQLFSYSPNDFFLDKDFEAYSEEDFNLIKQITREIVQKLINALSLKRKCNTHKYFLDMSRTIRSSIVQGGEILRIKWEEKTLKKRKLVFLLDISGSMEPFVKFMCYFMYLLCNQSKNIEAFTFSTTTNRVTKLMKMVKETEISEKLKNSVKGWLGGTRIGDCLLVFIDKWGHTILHKNTFVFIISDGWDVGDISKLQDALIEIKKRRSKIIWLNPLMGYEGFEPTCRGMELAVKYADLLFPLNNITSLMRLNKQITCLINNRHYKILQKIQGWRQ